MKDKVARDDISGLTEIVNALKMKINVMLDVEIATLKAENENLKEDIKKLKGDNLLLEGRVVEMGKMVAKKKTAKKK